jgi:ribosomal protein S27AE
MPERVPTHRPQLDNLINCHSLCPSCGRTIKASHHSRVISGRIGCQVTILRCKECFVYAIEGDDEWIDMSVYGKVSFSLLASRARVVRERRESLSPVPDLGPPTTKLRHNDQRDEPVVPMTTGLGQFLRRDRA